MIYVFKQSDKYIGGERESSDQGHCAYKYVHQLSDAKTFVSVGQAINWLERTAYRNGESKSLYNGCLCLIKIEAQTKTTYKEISIVE